MNEISVNEVTENVCPELYMITLSINPTTHSPIRTLACNAGSPGGGGGEWMTWKNDCYCIAVKFSIDSYSEYANIPLVKKTKAAKTNKPRHLISDTLAIGLCLIVYIENDNHYTI